MCTPLPHAHPHAHAHAHPQPDPHPDPSLHPSLHPQPDRRPGPHPRLQPVWTAPALHATQSHALELWCARVRPIPAPSAHVYTVSRSSDLEHFTPIPGSTCASTGSLIYMPPDARHGSFTPITRDELLTLLLAYPTVTLALNLTHPHSESKHHPNARRAARCAALTSCSLCCSPSPPQSPPSAESSPPSTHSQLTLSLTLIPTRNDLLTLLLAYPTPRRARASHAKVSSPVACPEHRKCL
jgi:hypothetical protein